MLLLDAINIVKGSVSTRDFVPVLTHIAVHEGRLHAFNGRVHISAPVPDLKGFSFTVPMVPFVAAVETCEGKPLLEVEGDKLRVRASIAKGFSATMPVGPTESFPMPKLGGKRIKIKGLLPVLEALHLFIGQDATRPWSSSIRFQDAIAMATNNVVLLEAQLPVEMPLVMFNLPVFAVYEIMRVGLEPQSMAITDNAVVLYYANGVWLRSTLLQDPWPDAKAILRGAHDGALLVPVPEGLLSAVQQITPFCPDPKHPIIRFGPGAQVSTLEGVTSASVGGLSGAGVGLGAYHAEPLTAVLSVALTADWGRFPRVPFTGAAAGVRLAGVLLGVSL